MGKAEAAFVAKLAEQDGSPSRHYPTAQRILRSLRHRGFVGFTMAGHMGTLCLTWDGWAAYYAKEVR